MKFMRSWLVFVALLAGSLSAQAQSGEVAAAAPQNRIESLVVGKAGGNTVLTIGFKQALPTVPAHFSITNPARLVFDLPGTANGLGYSAKAVNDGGLRSLNVVQAGERSRLVLNLDRPTRFEARKEGNGLVISLLGDAAPAQAAPAVGQHFASTGQDVGQGIRDIGFSRGQEGEGIVTIDLTSADTGIDVQKRGTKLEVLFRNTTLPETLRRQLDVIDFATPITTVTTRATGADVRMEIAPKGLWEHLAFQSDNRFIIKVKPVSEDPNKLFQGSKSGYQGELISLNFQNIPLRELLHVFADITNFNIVMSDSVAGNVSLRLNDVPWDQALEIVLQQKNLAMRKNGNVLRIAPRDELLALERQELEAQQQISAFEQPQTESFQINYQKAVDVQKLMGNKDQPVLSKVGSVVVDEYSNRIFVTDVPSRLSRVRDLLKTIDQPARQVMIEARVIEARDNFGRELGVRMSLFNNQPVRVASTSGHELFMTGGMNGTGGPMASSSFTQASTMGQLSFSLFNASLTRILGLELRAMEADGKGRSLSNPRVVTGNNVKAIIQQGDDIPTVTPGTANSPPTTTYRKALLSLETTPQITPDGRVKMKLVISKDRPDFSRTVLGNPTIITNKVETEVLIENGGTLVVGGVTAEENSENEDRIPFLGDLPYVGFLFKHKNTVQERKELLVFVTPRIIDDGLAIRQ